MKIVGIIFILLTLALSIMTFIVRTTSPVKRGGDKLPEKVSAQTINSLEKIDKLNFNGYVMDKNMRFGSYDPLTGGNFIIGTTSDCLKMYDTITEGWSEKQVSYENRKLRQDENNNLQAEYLPSEDGEKQPDGLPIAATISISPIKSNDNILSKKRMFNSRQVIHFYSDKEKYQRILAEKNKR